MDYNAPILIAGHTGLIGSAFTRLLKARGYDNLLAAGTLVPAFPGHEDVAQRHA